MNPDEYERLKEAEKAHLRKVRALKQQLHDARRKQGLRDALRGLDTSGLDEEFDRALRDVETQNLTAEARYELAMGALDEAAERERQRLEEERFDAERRQSAAADLVRRMKSEMGGTRGPDAASERPAPADRDASGDAPAGDDASASGDAPDDTPAKTIGRPRSGS